MQKKRSASSLFPVDILSDQPMRPIILAFSLLLVYYVFVTALVIWLGTLQTSWPIQ